MPKLPRFDTTLWSDVSRARGRRPSALNRLLARYRAPVRQYLIARGLQAADADDLTQDVFRRILERGLLREADRRKGRFRWLILGITRNVLREELRRRGARKRGGGMTQRPLDADPEDGTRLAELLSAPCEEEEFDRLWVANLLDQAIRAAQDVERKRGTSYLTLLQLKTIERVTYDELARRFGLGMQDVKNHLHRARKEIARQIRRLVGAYSSSPEEYEGEVRFVSRFLGDPRGA